MSYESQREFSRASLAYKIFSSRVAWRRFFAKLPFKEAGWDVLLALYIKGGGRRASLTPRDLIALDLQTRSSTQRQLRRLMDLKLVQGSESEVDRRMVQLRLTPEGEELIEGYLDEILSEHFSELNTSV